MYHGLELVIDDDQFDRLIRGHQEEVNALMHTIHQLRTQPATPREGDYTAVRLYIEHRRQQDEEFKQYCLTHTRRDLCRRLSVEFSWIVDPVSLGRNINRNR